MLNSVILHGRLTRDPELETVSTTGQVVTNLRVAMQRPKHNGQETGTDYVDVVAFGNTAENVYRHVTKGSTIIVTGCLHHREWTDNDDKKRQKLEVIAHSIEFLTTHIAADQLAVGDREL